MVSDFRELQFAEFIIFDFKNAELVVYQADILAIVD